MDKKKASQNRTQGKSKASMRPAHVNTKAAQKAAAKSDPRTENDKKENSFFIRPLADRVLIKPIALEELEQKSLSGIIIPDTVSKEKPEQGIVIATGPGKYEDGNLIPMSVQVGDKVLFSRYGYEDIKIEGEEYYILSESGILAIVRK